MDEVTDIAQPETYALFVKTTENCHSGGLVFFSLDEFDAAKERTEAEVHHIVSANDTKLVAWGLTSSITGEIVREFNPPTGRKK